MTKHCIIISIFALMPPLTFGGEFSNIQGVSVADALCLLGNEDAYDYWYDNQAYYDHYREGLERYSIEEYEQNDSSQEYEEEEYLSHEQDYMLPFGSYEEKEKFYKSYLKYNALYEGPCTQLWPEDQSMAAAPDEGEFSSFAQSQKRNLDIKKDRIYRKKYNEIISISAQEKPSKKANRIAYDTARRENLSCAISLRKAQQIAADNTLGRRAVKMRKMLNTLDKRANKQTEKHGKASSKSYSSNAQFAGEKANVWQPDAPEVLLEKRLQDAHRQHRPSLKLPK